MKSAFGGTADFLSALVPLVQAAFDPDRTIGAAEIPQCSDPPLPLRLPESWRLD
jgi:hypothetical protein